MDNNNRLHSIWNGLARNAQYSPYVDEEDISSFSRRAGGEGPEYFARGLATLRSALLNGLETGWFGVSIHPNTPRFAREFGPPTIASREDGVPSDIGRFGLKRHTVLPRFMYRAWSLVFREEDGRLRDDYDIGAVSCLNQLLAVFGKISGIHTPASELRVIAAFVNCETRLANTQIDLDRLISQCKLTNILDRANALIRRVLAQSDPREISPKHGSGAASCGTPVRERYGVPRFIPGINQVWPMHEYYFLNDTHLCDKLSEWQSTSEYVPCAKVILVPKDAKGPRLISCEPRETMWIQQGLMTKLYDVIESHPLTRGSVNFTDQTINQRAAKRGSQDNRLATLDLSEASDRLRLDVVQRLFPPNWWVALAACRSLATTMPDGSVVSLTKHAPMGSACCFPVMALVIWAVLKATLPPRTSHGNVTTVLVYGDDIVIPSEFYQLGVDVLEAIHFKVNVSKSYARGPFRESCGKEYINGVDITPVRLRAMPADDSESRARTIAFANNCSHKFGEEQSWLTNLVREWYTGVAERRFRGIQTRFQVSYDHERIPLTTKTLREALTREYAYSSSLSGVLDVRYPDNSHLRTRWNTRLQRREFRVLCPQPRRIVYAKDDWCHVFRSVVNPPFERSLGVDALSKRVSYKYRWVALCDLSHGAAED